MHIDLLATCLPADHLLLQESRGDINKSRNNECELVGNVTTIGADQLTKRTNVPGLDHTHDPGDNAHRERYTRSDTKRQSAWIVPRIQVVIVKVHLAEDDVLAEQDDEVLRGPISKQTEEILQVNGQLLAAANSKTQNRSETEYHPDEAGYARKGARKLLARDGSAVDGNNVDVDTREDQERKDQFGEPTRVQHGLNEETEAVVLVHIFPIGSVVETRGDDCACDHADGRWDGNTKCRHEEDLPAADVDRVVDVVVTGHCLP